MIKGNCEVTACMEKKLEMLLSERDMLKTDRLVGGM
jgi:hypothetical protein